VWSVTGQTCHRISHGNDYDHVHLQCDKLSTRTVLYILASSNRTATESTARPTRRKSLNMCIVTLSVLDRCRHELATIDYCKKADEKVDRKDTINVESGEATTPRETCTKSLGWLVYKSLTVSWIRQIKNKTLTIGRRLSPANLARSGWQRRTSERTAAFPRSLRRKPAMRRRVMRSLQLLDVTRNRAKLCILEMVQGV